MSIELDLNEVPPDLNEAPPEIRQESEGEGEEEFAEEWETLRASINPEETPSSQKNEPKKRGRYFSVDIEAENTRTKVKKPRPARPPNRSNGNNAKGSEERKESSQAKDSEESFQQSLVQRFRSFEVRRIKVLVSTKQIEWGKKPVSAESARDLNIKFILKKSISRGFRMKNDGTTLDPLEPLELWPDNYSIVDDNSKLLLLLDFYQGFRVGEEIGFVVTQFYSQRAGGQLDKKDLSSGHLSMADFTLEEVPDAYVEVPHPDLYIEPTKKFILKADKFTKFEGSPLQQNALSTLISEPITIPNCFVVEPSAED